MTVLFYAFLVTFTILALFFRADYLLVLVYFFVGVIIISRWWGSRMVKGIKTYRYLPTHVFFGEKIPVQLTIQNPGILPVIWLRFQESLPLELRTDANKIQEVISLNPKSEANYKYILEGKKRGIYKVGPTFLSSGDIFGIGEPETIHSQPDFVVVYPRLIPFSRIGIPSRSPIGNLRDNQPISEDPSRVRGKREYIIGDSLKRIDWKATASSGKLQVKLFEPSIALTTAIFLNLNANDFEWHYRIDATELSIIVAASIATWIISKRQAVGLYTNGVEPILEVVEKDIPTNLLPTRNPRPLTPKRGRGHLMHILETLARIQCADTIPLVQIIRREILHLPWGTTLILVSPRLDDELFDYLFQANRAGIKTILVPCGPVKNIEDVRKKAQYFGFPLFHILREKDLDIWRL